jgi:hypothetical protein
MHLGINVPMMNGPGAVIKPVRFTIYICPKWFNIWMWQSNMAPLTQ